MLLDAISRGRLYQVKFLLESGSVNVNVTDFNGQTPLMKAILLDDKMHHTRYKIVRLLLDHGAKVNLADKNGKTALMLAVIHGHKELAERILKCSLMDIDLNAWDYDGNTALIHAALEGHVIITSMLIASLKRFGLGVDKKNHRGLTALLEAVRYGQEGCAKVLYIEGGASLTIRDPENYMNAEEWAVQNELFNLVEMIEKTRQENMPLKSQNLTPEISDVDTSTLELPYDHDSNSRPQSPRDITKRPASRPESPARDVTKRPASRRESPAHDVTKRPPSRKTSNRSILTVPRVVHLRTQEETCVTVEVDSSRNPSPNDLEGPNLVPGSPAVNENEGKRLRSESGSKSTLLTKRRSPKPRIGSAGSAERCTSAKTEIQRLLSLYGIQNSITYRKGYDPALLPPSGTWPDPNAVNLSDSVDNTNAFGEMDFFSESAFGGRRSQLTSASSRRMSVLGGAQGREGRRMSILNQGNAPGDRRGSIMGRKLTTNQPPPGNMLGAFGRKSAGDRRMSMVPRPNLERPAMLRRMNTSSQLSPLVG